MRKFVLVLLFAALAGHIFAQFDDYEKSEIKHQKLEKADSSAFSRNFVFGGDMNLSFGTVTYISLSPTVGHYVTKWSMVGVYGTFSYLSSKSYNYRQTMYGGGVLAEVYPLQFVVLHAEAGMLNLYDYYNYTRVWTQSVFAGGGFRQRIGRKAMVNYLFLFNVNQNAFLPATQYKILILF